jgi:NAD(P)-dependent dehydrogenase (short-subunit alcohol dehydrogenase family)
VVVAEIDASRAAEIEGEVEQVVECDVTTAHGVDALRAAAGDDVDVLVNNVGHYLFRRHDFVESTEDEWRALHDVNFGHVLRCTHAFLPRMLRLGRGSIVNVSTVEAFRAAPQHAVYSAYKAAVTAFTRTLAMEVGNAGVRVNAIAPDLTESLQVRYSEWVPEEQRPLIPTWVPVGRFGTPDDIAGVALFLASDLSAFVTGTTIHADGGSLAAGGWFRTNRGGWTNRPLAP